jgi:hypothetical protein
MQSRVEKLEEKMSALKGSTDNQQFRTSVVFDQFSNEVDRKVREAEIRIKVINLSRIIIICFVFCLFMFYLNFK